MVHEITTLKPLVWLQIDNQSTIARIRKSRSSEVQKTVDVRFRTVKDPVAKGSAELEYQPTTEMAADIPTKALAHMHLSYMSQLSGLQSATECRALVGGI